LLTFSLRKRTKPEAVAAKKFAPKDGRLRDERSQ
jgi:hypothetical protein